LLAYCGLSNTPFALIILDRDLPAACIEKVDQLDRTTFKFKILSSDETSSVTDMIVSNYENFTSDGTTPLSYQPIKTYVTHDIGEQLNDVTTEYEFPSTVTIDAVIYNSGKGKLLVSARPFGQTKTFIYAITTKPVIIFRRDPFTEEWEAITTLDNGNNNLEVHSAFNVHETIYVTTGETGGVGKIYSCVNGTIFDLVGNADHHVYCGVASSDAIYFGTDQGNIYKYSIGIVGQGNKFEKKYSSIGDKVLGIEYAQLSVSQKDTLYVVTENYGSEGSSFEIDLTTDTILSLFPKSISVLNDVKIIGDTTNGNSMYIASNSTHEIWRTKYEEPLDFVKSYSSLTGDQLLLYKIPAEVLDETVAP